MIKLGLMGCGTVASYGHIPAILQSPDFELAAIYEPDRSRTEQLRSTYGIDVFADTEPFFRANFDAVVVTSPATYHSANVRDAARYGKHVLCEKPLAMNEAEAGEMIALMDREGLLLFTAFDYRFSPVSRTIKESIDGGLIGDVRSLRLSYIWNNHGKFVRTAGGEPQLNARRLGRMLEGGPMVDCGVHQIDLARWWLGSEVASFHAEGTWVDGYEAPDHIYVHMKHENKAHTLVEISYSYGHTAKEPVSRYVYDIIGTDGVIHYDREAKRFELRNSTGTTRFPFAGEKNFPGMYAAFAKALLSGSALDMPTGPDGLQATRIAREATERLIRQRER